MQLRSRSAMRRCGGLLIVYAALLLLVIWAPGLDSLRLAIVVGLGALGAALACRRKRWRCPQCGRELMDVPPEGG
jgi:UDP-N-acetylmuramyl pentapeptide phosphotransferase/UDP-N-acetylglucosamine-1-phosphate transferase